MKSYKINKKEAEQKLKKQKKENALDIISKSILTLSERFRQAHKFVNFRGLILRPLYDI